MIPPRRYSALGFTAPQLALPIAAGAILPWGNLVGRDSAGNSVLASDTAGLTVAGVAWGEGGVPIRPNDYTVDNTAGLAGSRHVCICTGIYHFRNSSANPVGNTELGKAVFVEDETTIAKTAAHNVVAGVVLGIDNGYVWLAVGPVGTLPGASTLGQA